MSIATYISIVSVVVLLIFMGARIYETTNTEKYTIILASISSPIMFGFLLFPVHFLISNICAPFYTKRYLNSNSKYFSNDPEQGDEPEEYPFVTIQVPVYDEDFHQVIKPMVRNCVRVRNRYPGECNIIINDDGIFKFAKDNVNDIPLCEKAAERINYYKKYKVGFTARKYKNRPGKFKKASNMNFGNNLVPYPSDIRILSSSECDELPRRTGFVSVTKILEGLVVNYNHKYIHYGDLRLGEYIVLLDSDSTLPSDFLVHTIKVFSKEKDLAYTQHYTVPTESSYQNYFSQFIADYTTNLYDIIFRISTRNGDVTPLIGHNLTLRKSALEKVSVNNNYWKEDRVSEDFDLCLRLHTAGYYGKYMLISNFPFGEGVSLTYEDEINKYSKFAYGASEVMMNPIKEWCRKLPVTKSFRHFIKSSNVPFSSKVGIISYLLTYFSISSGVLLSPGIAIFSCYVDNWELIFFDPFYATLFLIILFSIIAPISNIIVKFRLGRTFSVSREILSGLFFLVFYSGVSWPVFKGIFSHLCSRNMTWGSTVKTLENDTKLTIFINIIRNHFVQILYAMIMIMTGLLLYYIEDCRHVYSLFPVFTLGIGHIASPFLLTPNLYKKNEYRYESPSTPSPSNN